MAEVWNADLKILMRYGVQLFNEASDVLGRASAVFGVLKWLRDRKAREDAVIKTIEILTNRYDIDMHNVKDENDLIKELNKRNIVDAERIFGTELLQEFVRRGNTIDIQDFMKVFVLTSDYTFRHICEILKGDILTCRPIAEVLEANEEKEEYFRKTGPAKVDFEKNFVAERKEVNEIISGFRTNPFQMIVGSKASGKTVLLRNVAYKLWIDGEMVYHIRAKKIESGCNDFMRDAQKMDGYLIIEDVHQAPKSVNEALSSIRNTNLKVLLSARESYHYYKDMIESGDLDALETCKIYNIKPFSAADSIIDNYAQHREKSINEMEKKEIKEYSKDNLWILSYALKAWNEKTRTIEEDGVRKEVRKDMNEIERKYGVGAREILMSISVLSKYEINASHLLLDSLLLSQPLANTLSDGGELIKEVSEGSKIETFYRIPHSVLAELYLKHCRVKCLSDGSEGNEDSEDVSFLKHYLSLPVGNWFEVIEYLYYENTDLLRNLLCQKGIVKSLAEKIDKEQNLECIENCFFDILFTDEGAVRELLTMIDIKELAAKMNEGKDIQSIGFYTSEIARADKETAKKITRMINLEKLAERIDEKKDFSDIGICISGIARADKVTAKKLARMISVEKLAKRIDRENDIFKIGTFLFHIARADKVTAKKLARSIDPKKTIEKFYDTTVTNIGRCLFCSLRADKQAAERLTRMIDLKMLARKIDQEEDVISIGYCISSVLCSSRDAAKRLARMINLEKLAEKVDKENELDFVFMGFVIPRIAGDKKWAKMLLRDIYLKNGAEEQDYLHLGCISGIARADKVTAKKLARMISVEKLAKRIDRENDIGRICLCFLDTQINREAAKDLVEMIDIEKLAGKIDKENSIDKVRLCLSTIAESNRDIAKKIGKKIKNESMKNKLCDIC